MMHTDALFAIATARHARRVAAAEHAASLRGYPARPRRRLITLLPHQRGKVAAACHGHGSDANRVADSSAAPVARSRMALE